MIDIDYTDDQTLLANRDAWAESLLHSLKQAAGGMSLYANANKKDPFEVESFWN